MFTGNPLPDVNPPKPEDGFADGFIHLCPQKCLGFGSDRRKPTFARPVVRIRYEGARAVVLPCTTNTRGNPSEFFALDGKVEWTKNTFLSSRAYWRYEVISAENLRAKIGAMQHGARIDLLKWLVKRY